ncbi:hypothetical protein BGX21_005716, partial [Mortierella sp. AD011]
IHKFVGYIEDQATELIWKPRCKATITRERELGVAGKQKESCTLDLMAHGTTEMATYVKAATAITPLASIQELPWNHTLQMRC